MKNNGIAYRVNNNIYITPTDEVQEVVQFIPIHELPLSKPWMLGVMHLRGEIIPVSNLQLFLASISGQRTTQRTNHKKPATLIVNHNNWTYGIEVPEIVSMESIPDSYRILDTSEDGPPIYRGKYEADNVERTILSLNKLVELNDFINSCRI